jgi:ribosomal protein S18 acetylase RimI-like enzyme
VPVTVRRATPDDYAEVADLTARVYVAEGHAPEDYVPALRSVASRDASATVLVADDDGRLVGAVTVATRGGEWAEQAVPGEAVIRMLVVDPSARGTGAGAALVQACIDQAREDGCRLVRLSTQASMTAAHRLYGRAGFVRTPSYDWSPVLGVDLLGYVLPLVPWCDQCGEELTPEGHDRCRRALDPPRFCGHCRRRMVVQVTPTGWTAKCVEHGTTTG